MGTGLGYKTWGVLFLLLQEIVRIYIPILFQCYVVVVFVFKLFLAFMYKKSANYYINNIIVFYIPFFC
jgi:hypothetical protein